MSIHSSSDLIEYSLDLGSVYCHQTSSPNKLGEQRLWGPAFSIATAANITMPLPVPLNLFLDERIKIYKFEYTMAPDRANTDLLLVWWWALCGVPVFNVFSLLFMLLGRQLLFQQHANKNENGLVRNFLGCFLPCWRCGSAVVPLQFSRCRSARNTHVADVRGRRQPHVRLCDRAELIGKHLNGLMYWMFRDTLRINVCPKIKQQCPKIKQQCNKCMVCGLRWKLRFI